MLNLTRDLRWFYGSDVLYFPDFDLLPSRLKPILAKTVMLRLHENKNVTCAHESCGRPLPSRSRVMSESMLGQYVCRIGRDRCISLQSRPNSAGRNMYSVATSGSAISLSKAATVDVAGADKVDSHGTQG